VIDPPAPWPTPWPNPLPGYGAATVSVDQASYDPGEAVRVTVTNTGSTQLSGGGRYRCTLVDLEILNFGGWQVVSDPAGICPAIARLLEPGGSATETFPAPGPGTYRVVARLTGANGEPVTATSRSFTVERGIVPNPSPVPIGRLTVAPDRTSYRTGETITATVRNNTRTTVSGGGGYRCGLVDLQVSTASGWQPAPGSAEVCTLQALLLPPGQTRTESFAAPEPGTYRLLVRVSREPLSPISSVAPEPIVAVSAPFTVR
jgi:hypothetical protein